MQAMQRARITRRTPNKRDTSDALMRNSEAEIIYQYWIQWKISTADSMEDSTADLMEDSTADLDVDDNEIVNSVLLFFPSYISSSSSSSH
ncbi:hypothetical protein BDBG_16847 [Blastomyces gilchristii SLH14081]|uniref:Uncharacterized protein n=1 Tax=Blastomyces gilchristii (strain SLH14081) TaxID=559298 RepID=A0A179UJY7_BLAGS|nr:uncharacterized protein BDBG_16847 [Blastomyces gilchristii SLH14081]OAT07528.1 hypothetical protein BDBG_16847 [Blastomyces gilchristii SLH14081]